MDHIHTANQVVKKSVEYIKPHYMPFIDDGKAFDSVSPAAVLEVLKQQGIEETHVRLLYEIYKGCTGRTILHPSAAGARKACLLSVDGCGVGNN